MSGRTHRTIEGGLTATSAVRTRPSVSRTEQVGSECSEKMGTGNFRKGRVACPLRWVSLYGRAGADQVAVAVRVVDARDGRPELALAHPRRGKRGLLAAVRPVPLR